jgi:hypothetical protein
VDPRFLSYDPSTDPGNTAYRSKRLEVISANQQSSVTTTSIAGQSLTFEISSYNEWIDLGALAFEVLCESQAGNSTPAWAKYSDGTITGTPAFARGGFLNALSGVEVRCNSTVVYNTSDPVEEGMFYWLNTSADRDWNGAYEPFWMKSSLAERNAQMKDNTDAKNLYRLMFKIPFGPCFSNKMMPGCRLAITLKFHTDYYSRIFESAVGVTAKTIDIAATPTAAATKLTFVLKSLRMHVALYDMDPPEGRAWSFRYHKLTVTRDSSLSASKTANYPVNPATKKVALWFKSGSGTTTTLYPASKFDCAAISAATGTPGLYTLGSGGEAAALQDVMIRFGEYSYPRVAYNSEDSTYGLTKAFLKGRPFFESISALGIYNDMSDANSAKSFVENPYFLFDVSSASKQKQSDQLQVKYVAAAALGEAQLVIVTAYNAQIEFQLTNGQVTNVIASEAS